MHGTLALIGGAEFLPGNEAVDRYLIARADKVRGVIIPTAAARENPETAARNGARWFQSLGATMQSALIVDKATANDDSIVAQLQDANFFYLPGGDPRYLLETLRESKAWDVIERKYRAGQAIVAGSSAGAMALCAWMTDPFASAQGMLSGGYFPALNLVPAPCVVMPHFSGSVAPALWQNLPESARLLGIAEKTGAIFDGEDWVVIGPGNIAEIERNGEIKRYRNGERFNLR